jgi:pimeloyl-ACP methyl ester carboxylesterase
MSFLEDIFDADTSIGRLFYTALVVVVFALVGLLAITGLVLHGVSAPPRRAVPDIATLPSPPEVVEYRVAGDPKPRMAWFYTGPTTSPTIILCHGYRSSRAEIQTMARALQNDSYNVFIFDFSGHGEAPGSSSLGFRELQELQEVVRVVTERVDLDANRLGLWGTDMGAYAALAVAADEPRVRAVVVDSAFDDPRQLLDLQVASTGLGRIPLVRTFARWGFVLMNWSSRHQPTLSQRVLRLNHTAKLFVQGRDNPALADATLQLFLKSPEPRQQQMFPKSNYATMMDEERRAYEREVINFFLVNLPVFAAPASPAPAASR